MAKEEVVQAAVAAIQAAETAALTEQFGSVYEAGIASVQVPADLVEAEKAGYEKGYAAAVAADTTPISQEKFDALEALFKSASATLEAVKAALKLVPTPAPVEETPVQEQPVVVN